VVQVKGQLFASRCSNGVCPLLVGGTGYHAEYITSKSCIHSSKQKASRICWL
jgi:hypothetical protein